MPDHNMLHPSPRRFDRGLRRFAMHEVLTRCLGTIRHARSISRRDVATQGHPKSEHLNRQNAATRLAFGQRTSTATGRITHSAMLQRN